MVAGGLSGARPLAGKMRPCPPAAGGGVRGKGDGGRGLLVFL